MNPIVEVPCPNCGLSTQEPARFLVRASSVICAHCGHVIQIDDDVRSMLGVAMRARDDELP
jgi:uncharacterized Zn finger protein